MSQDRNIKWLNDRRIVYRKDPDTDMPTIETKQYKYYEHGTYQCYHLFNSKAKITTYKSLKWHMLVLYYLNQDNEYGLSPFFEHVARFIANKDNGFVTFFIKQKILDQMIIDVYNQGGDPPANKLRKVVFKPYSGLDLSGKLKIVGQLIGRSSIDKFMIYDAMIEISEAYRKITIGKIAKLLKCSTRTIHRHMSDDLKQEKQRLNEEL
jgi:phage antirepressor YoqD-like protein